MSRGLQRSAPVKLDGGKAESEPVSVRVAREILAQVRSGDFPTGDRLPSEQALAERFGVSRPSLREALSALQFAGYLESRQGYGTVVIAADEPPPRRVGAELSTVDPVDVVEARLVLEPEAVRIAALDPDERYLAEARTILDGMWLAATAPGELGAQSDIALHVALANCCRNPVLRQDVLALLGIANPPGWRAARAEAWNHRKTLEGWAIEHEATLSAIGARQPDRAARCARRHLVTTVEGLVSRESTPAQDRRRLADLLLRHSLG